MNTTRKIPYINVNKLTNIDLEIIHLAIKEIQLLCDGAKHLDGCGFNKADAEFGKILASTKFLTRKQAAVGLRMIIKYKRQLRAVIVMNLLDIIERVTVQVGIENASKNS
jgi:hypothetical protein